MNRLIASARPRFFNLVTLAMSFAAALSLAGCLDDDDEDPAADDGVYSTESSELRIPGGWNPPGDVRAAGRSQFVPYQGPPPWQGGANCSGRLLDGTRQLGDHIRSNFRTSVTSYGGYDCRRNTANASETSVHGTGRALDLFIPRDAGDADNGRGDQVANWLVANAQAIGVQYIIWDRADWGGDRGGDKMNRYTGPNPHTDHIHLELTHDGANRRTPWFNGGSACEVRNNGRLYCTNTANAAMRAQPNLSSAIVNRLRTTYSYFECWGTGQRHAGGNTTWYRTIGDDNASRGWVPAVDLATSSAFDADPSARGLVRCP